MAPRVPDISRPESPIDSEGTLSPPLDALDLDGNPIEDYESYENHEQEDDRIVVVVGVGYVGEHLVQVFAKKFTVYGLDVSEARVELLRRTTFANSGNVHLTTDPEIIARASLVCISVPTLLKAGNVGIDDSYVRSAVATVEKYVEPGTTVVMESSVTVGMTRELLGHLPNKFAGEEKEGRGEETVYVGFSPERVDPGRTEPAAEDIPKILSGLSNDALGKIVDFYGRVYTTVVPVSSCETAEMCKLYENCFRMVNIAYANEMADACKSHGIDAHEVVQASGTKPFWIHAFNPSIGVGGHCIPVNPYYLFSNNSFPLLAMATDRMEDRPIRLAKTMLTKHKKKNGRPLEKILVVGTAFKPGQSIMSYSPALSFAKSLKVDGGCDVTVYDPLVPKIDLAKQGLSYLSEREFDREGLRSFDAVAVTMRQHKVDFEVLSAFEREGGVVEFFCK